MLNLKKQIELKGHSGCKVYLCVRSEEDIYVRKISMNKEYNSRLQRQCAKQNAFISNLAMAPRIYREGWQDDLYCFDMEYVRGETLSSIMRTCAVDKIDDFVKFLFDLIICRQADGIFTGQVERLIQKKINNLLGVMNKKMSDPLISKAFNHLLAHKWSRLPWSESHGDLTLENIIYVPQKGYYLIDFLDTSYDTWISDISKLLMDLLVGWSFRYEFIRDDVVSENIKVRVLLLRKKLFKKLSSVFKEEELWNNIYCHLLLDLLRIVPYVKSSDIYDYIHRSLEVILELFSKGGFHEHFNTSLCWPVYEISRN